jgi:hypothetical protein
MTTDTAAAINCNYCQISQCYVKKSTKAVASALFSGLYSNDKSPSQAYGRLFKKRSKLSLYFLAWCFILKNCFRHQLIHLMGNIKNNFVTRVQTKTKTKRKFTKISRYLPPNTFQRTQNVDL